VTTGVTVARPAPAPAPPGRATARRRVAAARLALATGLAVASVAMAAVPATAASTVRSQQWWLQNLHVTKAWMSARGAGVTVAVLDTGVYPNQPDLTGSVTTGPDYTGSQEAPGGAYWGIHGTAMASLIAGHGHGAGQNEGIMGVAPAAKVLSVRVTLESTDPLLTDASLAAGLPAAIAHGIKYAVRHGATVIDLPLDPVTAAGAAGSGGSPAERAAVAYALAHQVVLVAPAGDVLTPGVDPVNFPASYPGVISVGAFDSSFIKGTFSSQQPYVTLTAAGVGVIAAAGASGYTQLNSTSAASAVVAGIVALIRAQFPTLAPAQVTRALTSSTVYRRPGGQATGSGAGTVDAAAALAAAASINAAVTPSASPASTSPPATAPRAPAVHNTSGSLSRSLISDAYLAGAVFVLLLLAIFGWRLLRRRRARAARLAEVRAAAEPPARKDRQTATAAVGASPDEFMPAPPDPGLAAIGAAPSASGPFPPAPYPAGTPGGGSGYGGGQSVPGIGFTGSSFTGSAGLAGSGSAFPRQQPPPAGPAGPGGSGAGDLAGRLGAGYGAAGSDVAAGMPHDGGWGTADPADSDAGGTPGAGGVPGGWGAANGGAGNGDSPDVGAPGPGPAARGAGPHRQAAPKAPDIAGRPPWDPAPEPAGDVPWAQLAASATSLSPGQPPEPVEMPLPAPPRAEPSAWDLVAEEAWPGGPAASRSTGGASNGWAGPDQPNGTEADGTDADSGSQPIYVWNPGAATESSPAMPPEQGKRR
jgi:subtilisin family serine protease